MSQRKEIVLEPGEFLTVAWDYDASPDEECYFIAWRRRGYNKETALREAQYEYESGRRSLSGIAVFDHERSVLFANGCYAASEAFVYFVPDPEDEE